jgi:hypothetical protein
VQIQVISFSVLSVVNKLSDISRDISEYDGEEMVKCVDGKLVLCYLLGHLVLCVVFEFVDWA